jgi:excinuclease ABC subunit B
MDNRPLKFDEIEQAWPQVVFVSATPGPYELDKCEGEVVEQIIRPTGLIDPQVEVSPASGQVADLLERCQKVVAEGERVLVTTLTKRLAEDLSNYLAEQSLRTRYLHSEIETIDRVEILRDLRAGEFDVLVGVNLLREGLDLPEVSLVCILDADKTGFLRSQTSMIQQMGRAARNVNATVVLYADKVTEAMQAAIDETQRRREKQLAFNAEHGITPQTIRKAIRHGLELEIRAHKTARQAVGQPRAEEDANALIERLEKEMLEAAEAMEFEKAAALRDRLQEINEQLDAGEFTGESAEPAEPKAGTPGKKVRRKTKRRRSMS